VDKVNKINAEIAGGITRATFNQLNTTIAPVNRYFQYKLTLETLNTTYTPYLQNITAYYQTLLMELQVRNI